MLKEKSLSQQICELCGIEAKRVKPLLCELKGYQHLTCEYCPLKSDECKTKPKVYPDFENPENFVKLLELDISNKTTPATLWGYLCDKNKSLSLNSKQFLEMLAIYLKKEKFHFQCQAIVRSKIKQSIRDYDGWVWG